MPTASTAAPARCDGCAGAGLAARGPVVLRPQEASRRPPRGGSDPVGPGPPPGPSGSLGRPGSARADGDFCPGPLFGFLLLPHRWSFAIAPIVLWRAAAQPPLLARHRCRLARASRISARQHAGLPSRRRSLPRWVLVP